MRAAIATTMGLERRCTTCGRSLPGSYILCPHDGTPMAPQGTDPLVGQVLARTYRVTRLMARGGMGLLYEAEHMRLPRRITVKVIHEGYAGDAQAVARFEREARAAAQIDSEYVLDVLDVVRTPDGRPALLAEHLAGEDLQMRLDRVHRLPVAEALRIARQLCRGLAAAHCRSIIHRDIKPSNVFLKARSDGRVTVKILDFGVAKLAGSPEITGNGTIVGTPAYMAPEQARGAAQVDGRADLYGIAAVLYRMITGHAPHEAPNATASLTRLLHEDPTPARAHRPAVSAELDLLLQSALSRDPAARPADVLAFETALAGHDTGDDTAETDVGPWEPRNGHDATLVLPRGSVEGAAGTAQVLRAERIRVLCAGALASAVAGLGVAATVSLLDKAAWGAAALGTAAVLTALTIGHHLLRVHRSGPGTRRLRLALRASLTHSLGALGALHLLGLSQQVELPPLAALASATTIAIASFAYAMRKTARSAGEPTPTM